MKRQAAAVFMLIVPLVGSAHAEPVTELSFYGATGAARSTDLSGNDPGGAGNFSFNPGWNHAGSQGIRLTFWQNSVFGWGLEVSNAGVVADDGAIAGAGVSSLSLDDGLGLLSVNAFRRSGMTLGGLQPYVGAGVGVSLPQVRFDGGGTPTDQRQLTGASVQVIAGARYPVNSAMSLFGEVQGSYSMNMADLAGGGSLDAGIASNNINFGISLGF